MKRERGKHFSPDIFDVFMEISVEIDKIRESFGEQQDLIVPPEIDFEIKKILSKS